MRSPPAPVRLRHLPPPRRRDVVFEATADDASSRSVWLGEDGIIAGSLESATLVTSATLSPAGRRARRRLPGTPDGRSSTCPSRAAAGAEGGTLVMLAVVNALLSRRSTRCSRRSRRGSLRTGRQRHEVQARAQCLQAIHLVGFGEAMSLARAVGLDPDDVGPALVDRLGGPVTQMAWAADQQLPEGELRLVVGLKDLRYAPAMAADVPAPMLDVAVTAGRGRRGMGRSRLDRGQRRAPGHRPAPSGRD